MICALAWCRDARLLSFDVPCLLCQHTTLWEAEVAVAELVAHLPVPQEVLGDRPTSATVQRERQPVSRGDQ